MYKSRHLEIGTSEVNLKRSSFRVTCHTSSLQFELEVLFMNTYEFKSSRFFFNVLPIGSFNRGLHSFNSRVLSASSGVFGCCWFLDCYQTFPAGWFCFSLVTCCLYIVNTAALFVGFCCRGLLPFFLPSSFNCRLGCCLLLLRCSVSAVARKNLWLRQCPWKTYDRGNLSMVEFSS